MARYTKTTKTRVSSVEGKLTVGRFVAKDDAKAISIVISKGPFLKHCISLYDDELLELFKELNKWVG